MPEKLFALAASVSSLLSLFAGAPPISSASAVTGLLEGEKDTGTGVGVGADELGSSTIGTSLLAFAVGALIGSVEL